MTNKELSQFYYLKKEIRSYQQKIKELESRSTYCSNLITGLPNASNITDRVGKYAIQLANIKCLLNLEIKKCLRELDKLERYIEEVDDSLVRQIIMYRFIICYNWRKTAQIIGGNNKPESLRKKLYRYLKTH